MKNQLHSFIRGSRLKKHTCVSLIPGPAVNKTTKWKPFIRKFRYHFLCNKLEKKIQKHKLKKQRQVKKHHANESNGCQSRDLQLQEPASPNEHGNRRQQFQHQMLSEGN